MIVGSGISLVICGWSLLFIYYNTCGKPQLLDKRGYVEWRGVKEL
jgi:hypothetical protein